MRFRQNSFLLGLLLLISAPVCAERTDEVTLYNGNTITGEVKSLQQGKLKVKTDRAGTIYFEWEFVHHVTSSEFFEVENLRGEFFYGMLAQGTEAQELVVVGPAESVVLEMDRVVAMLPIRQTFWGRVDGSINLGGSYTSADSIFQYSFEGDATYRQQKYEASVGLSSIQNRQDDREDIVRDSLAFDYTRFHKNRYFGTGSLAFSRNSELGYDFRTQIGYAFGRAFMQSVRSRFSARFGLSVSREKPTGEDFDDTYLSAAIGGRYHFFLYNFPKTDITVDLTLYPGISEWPRVQGDFSATLKREIVTDFTVNFSAYDSYDSDPPGDATENHDYGVILSIGWTF